MNKLVYSFLSILYLSETAPYKFQYDYLKPNVHIIRAETYSYLKDNNDEYKKITKKCVTKGKLKCPYYKSCLGGYQGENKIKHLEKKYI